MPSRKKTSLSQNSRDAKRKRVQRSQETQEERELRLHADQERHAAIRAAETIFQREIRLNADRERHLGSRASETFTEREMRLTDDRDRHSQLRASETFVQYEQRLTCDRDQHSISRSHETEEQHEVRVNLVRQYYDLIRQENQDHLSFERQRIREIRQSETDEQRQLRLGTDRLRHSLTQMTAESEVYTPNSDELPWNDKTKSGFCYSRRIHYSAFACIGDLTEICSFCQALKWRKEPPGLCCSAGKVKLNIFQQPPEPLRSLLLGEHQHSKHFLDHIRSYNSAFQMTSFGAKQIVEGSFMPTFKVQGQIYHLMGSLLPGEDDPKFLQIYFVSDYLEQAHIRNKHFPSLLFDLIDELQGMLHSENNYIHSFKTALESVPNSTHCNYKFVINADRRQPTEHRGRYNAPSTNEVAVVMVDQECDKRDIILRTHDNRLNRINETHRAYDTLQYPLIYCRGEDGYHFAMNLVNPSTGAVNCSKKISALQFYSYLLQLRHNQFIFLQRFRGLLNQFIVDMYAKIETERLVFIRTHQRSLRAENYIDLQDAMQQDTNAENLGRMVILPSSFTGGPRYMHQRTQDAFCYVRKYGRPDLFITFTTNPKWEEIKKELLPGQASHDRHDIVSRVFHLKLKLLVDLLTKEKVFGTSMCYMYSVEWQKRGLPHAHILLWLQDKIRPNDVDKIIKAEFPDPASNDNVLYEIVKANMVHGPCGTLNANSPCMRDGRCTKRYPKSITDSTITGEDGYPKYRRRSPINGGFTAEVRMRGHQVTVDNRWVVPYSPVLTKTFNAHINVEVCNSVESIKYICKYINKGSDQTTFALSNDRDEVSRFQSGRYISSSEAVWRILSFPIHERYPPVVHLDVHVEGGQRIYFDTENVRQRLENPRKTTLQAFFNLCESDQFARSLLYEEVPSFYTYDKQRGNFNRRKRGVPVEGVAGVVKEHVIGRVYTVHPNNTECYYLRMLLGIVRGPISFAALKTVNNFTHTTFHDACRARGLLDDDQHWDDALAEACISNSPRRLRNLFSVMLTFCSLSEPHQLWQKYCDRLCEDFVRELCGANAVTDALRINALNRCLKAIEAITTSIGGLHLIQYGLPGPNFSDEFDANINYNPTELSETLSLVSSLTEEQKIVYERICGSVDDDSGEMIFLDAPGGTGKTFLIKIILATMRQQGKVALAVASSGIAATLLPDGKTAHAMFKIPIQLDNNENPVCDISRNSEKARLLQDCCLIVWDECTMAHRKAIEAVHRTLQDIRRNDRPMGGISFLFSGDFRQTLPVVVRGSRADEVNACLKSSFLWRHIKRMHLTINMRAQRGTDCAQVFSELLLKIGEGQLETTDVMHQIFLPHNLCKKLPSLNELITSVYDNPDLILNRENSWFCERSILAPRNDQVLSINSSIMTRIEGQSTEYTSINRVVDQDDATNYPIEFLNSLLAPGLPAHKIVLKVGVPIILMRNLCPPKLCNGTRLRVTNLQRNIIEAQILTGCGIGESVFIPRIPLIPNNYPFRFKRVQFPVNVCFAMTINKAQGQTFQTCGVDLTNPCFSHGQLYVALSRVGSSNHLFVYAPDNLTQNVVYSEAL